MDPFFTPTHHALKAQVRVFAEEEVLPLEDCRVPYRA
jgi:hypothetical protein